MAEQQDLKKSDYVTYRLPPVFAISENWQGNTIQQLIVPASSVEGIGQRYDANRAKGMVFVPRDDSISPILLATGRANPPGEFEYVLREIRKAGHQAPTEYRWIRHPASADVPPSPIDYEKCVQDVIESWRGSFSFLEEDPKGQVRGLRPPQIGAIHAVHAHWVLTSHAATIVMPTGTGKTETMLSILVSKRCPRLLVIVPTDALRTQIADKFLTLGI